MGFGVWDIHSVSVFAVMAAPPLGAIGLEQIIAAKYQPDDWLKITDVFWLVSDTGIAKNVSDKIGLSSDPATSAIVIAFNGYYGRAANHIWEWIALKSSPKVANTSAA